jgi:hypothetical protein
MAGDVVVYRFAMVPPAANAAVSSKAWSGSESEAEGSSALHNGLHCAPPLRGAGVTLALRPAAGAHGEISDGVGFDVFMYFHEDFRKYCAELIACVNLDSNRLST